MIVVIVIVFLGLSTTLINFNLNETRNLIGTVNETASNTQEILSSGNRTGQIISEIKDFQQFVNEKDENQTAELLPVFFESFNQTERIESIVSALLLQQEVRTNQTERLLTAFDRQFNQTDLRENFQYRQANETNALVENMTENLERIADLLAD